MLVLNDNQLSSLGQDLFADLTAVQNMYESEENEEVRKVGTEGVRGRESDPIATISYLGRSFFDQNTVQNIHGSEAARGDRGYGDGGG